MRIMSHQIEYIKKDMWIIKISDGNSVEKHSNWNKNSILGFNTVFELVEARFSKLENRLIEIIQSEE